MRLIDAEMLKSALNSGGGESVDINISKSMPLGEIVDTVIQAYRKCLFTEIEKIPTAYDVDKVVSKIKESSTDEDGVICYVDKKPVITKETVIKIIKFDY